MTVGNTAVADSNLETNSEHPSSAAGAPEAEVLENIQPLARPAAKARGFARQLMGADQQAFLEMDDRRAYEIIESMVQQGKLDVGVGAISSLFPSESALFDHIDANPFGTVNIVDDLSGVERNVPTLETAEAATIKDRMSVTGLVPLYVAESVVFVLRVDANSTANLADIVKNQAPAVIRELKRVNPELDLDYKTIAFVPVTSGTYDLISSAMVNPVYRAERAIESCDAHFKHQAGITDLVGDPPKFSCLNDLYKANPIEAIIRAMHFSPFLDSGISIKPAKPSDSVASTNKENLGVTRKDVSSVFDTEEPAAKLKFLLTRSQAQGFMPLHIETDSGQTQIVLGFKAYVAHGNSIASDPHAGGYLKRDWDSVVAQAALYLQTLASTFPDRLPKNLNITNVKLVPIPNAKFDSLFTLLGDPIARKNALNIIDRPSGILNFQQLLKEAVTSGAQEIYLHLREKTGPSVRFGIGADVVPAPFSYSIDAFVKTVQALMAIMTNKVINVNECIGGHIHFVGARPADFATWEQCIASNTTPPTIPGGDVPINIYPRELHEISLRLQYTKTTSGPVLVIRIHRLQQTPPLLTNLGLRPEVQSHMERLREINSGTVLITAPTGCGKTTLLAAIIQEKNVPGTVIMTMEKPPEFAIEGVIQVDINPEAGRTEEKVLASMLRSAPHIIMLGEIRDSKEADIALQAGLTGHLVYSTLHTNDAPEAMVRLLNMGVDPFFLGSSVNAIVAQRLIRQFKPLPHSIEYMPDPNIVEAYDCRHDLEALIGRRGIFETPIIAYRPHEEKVSEAYKGRVPVNEIILNTPDLQRLVSQSKWSMSDLIQVLRTQKNAEIPFEPMIVGGIRWVLEGRTSLQALYLGEKVIPRTQFVIYADEIITAVKAWQAEQMH